VQFLDGKLLFSASDLVNFLGCRHATYLDLRNLTDEVVISEHDAATVLIFEKGIEHEKRYLAALKARALSVVEITAEGFDVPERAALTREAMRAGAEVIYQAALVVPPWLGIADFLERIEEGSNLGGWSYLAVDTKLPRRAKPEHVIQLTTYSKLIGSEQGRTPTEMHVELGNGERVSFRVSDFAHYHSIAQRRLETFANRPPEISIGEPCGHCRICRWSDHCQAGWKATDHLTLVARITRHQIRRMWDAGISTVRTLAVLSAGSRVPGIHLDTFDRLRHQATLQTARRDTGANYVETLALISGKGFARLPRPHAGDIFFDMEGAQFFEGGSLEYLFGFITVDDGEPRFTAYWAHDRRAEKLAFESAMDFITARLEKHPDAFLYHYASYEETALKRLAMVHGTREAQVDDLLRHRKLVDVYKVVREGVRISEPAYSLKNVEVFFNGDRSGEVKTALDSMIVYDQWQQTGDQALLDQIGAYNKVDCRSLMACRDWLLSLRPSEVSWFGTVDPADADLTGIDPAKAAKRKEAEERSAALVKALLEGAPEADREWRELAGQLVDFHKREAKPEWWAMFNRQDMTEEELIDDAECIGGLELDHDRPPFQEKRSIVHSYRFPAQDFKIGLGCDVLIADTLASRGEIVMLDEDAFEISLKRGKNREPLPHRFSLIPKGPLGDQVLRTAIARYIDAVVKGDEDQYAALTGILRRDYPRFQGLTGLGDDPDEVTRAIRAIGCLDHSHLLIQGPPGGGKTYTASHAIVEMLARGKRVGVSSHSHKAIKNLLKEVEKVAAGRKLPFRGVKKSSYEGQCLNGTIIEDTLDPDYAIGSGHDLIAGTAWLFAREELDQQLDYLFVDEAGQVSLANMIAMGVSAKNVILVGDQMQLSQPLQGSHPGRSGLSALEHLLDGAATVPRERGIFLSKTRRMHSDLCRFVSDAFYDGRLMAEAGNERQCLVLDPNADPALAPTGLRFISVEHEGCSQKSEPEADRVCQLYHSLLGQRWTDRERQVRPIGVDDILVVSPYNMQVNLLRSRLPEGACVGTVDRFQGQEAAVVLISMATSSDDDLPRQIGFLYSRNRLNVAISRARCLAVIVASPRLLETSCSTIEQLRLVNTLCWTKNFADSLLVKRRGGIRSVLEPSGGQRRISAEARIAHVC
jgi:predicted RecB family nuclease